MDLIIIMIAYLYILVSVFSFSGFRNSYENLQNKRVKNNRKKILVVLSERLDMLKQHNSVEENKNLRLYNLLKNPRNLAVFHEIIEEIPSKNDRDLLLANLMQLFFLLSKRYSSKANEYKALFVYVVSRLNLGKNTYIDMTKQNTEFNRMVSVIFRLLYSESIYVKENTIKAIVSFSSVDLIISMLKSMNEFDVEINNKLLSDRLLEFNGDMQVLVDTIITQIQTFSEPIQCAVINFLRFLPSEYVRETWNSKLLKVMSEHIENKEVFISCVRYFKKWPYSEVEIALINILKYKDDVPWEYTAISASTLAAYNSENTINVLKTTLTSANWYIRYNSAMSLIEMNVDTDSVVKETQDVYAKEILKFCSEKVRFMNTSKQSNLI